MTTNETKTEVRVEIRYSTPHRRGSRLKRFQGRMANKLACAFAGKVVERDGRILRWTTWESTP